MSNLPTLKCLVWPLALACALLASSAEVCAQSAGRSKTGGARAAAQQTPARPGPEFEQAIKLGDEARLAGRFDEAIRFYGKALNLQPKWTEGWWNVGAIFYEQDHFPEARDAFSNVVALDPTRGAAWGMLGLCEYQTRDYARAGDSLQRGRVLGLGGNKELEAVVRYHMALLYNRFEQFEVAYEVLTEFVRAGNENPRIIEAFGLAMLRMPFVPDEIPPDKHEEILLAGRAGWDMAARRMEQARAAFDTLLTRYPNEPNVHYAFGVYMLSQDADAAMKEFRRELEISPAHYPTMVQMAFEYLKRDEYKEALPLAEKAVQLAPKMYPARNVLGRVLLELGQVDRAIKELEEGARLAPSSPEMHYALGRSYRRAGREADAKREVELFQKLQEQYNARRNAQLTGSPEADNQPRAKP